MRITRYISLSENQFLGCTSAFVDSLFGSLNAALLYLKKLEGQPKGAAFSYEMQLDQNRYGALIVPERWADFVHAFREHLQLGGRQDILDRAPARVQTAENILGRANQLIDAAPQYTSEVVAAGAMAFQSLDLTFEQEMKTAQQMTSLGPMLPEEFVESRRIFLADLAAR